VSEPARWPIEDFLRSMQVERGASENTLRAYRADLGDLRQWAIDAGLGARSPGELTRGDLRRWLGEMGERCDAATLQRRLSATRSFYRYLNRRKLCAENPAAQLATPKSKQQLGRFLNVDEAFALLDKPRDLDDPLSAPRRGHL
jgi:site-specific recombinase XerD